MKSNKDKINNIPIIEVLNKLWYYENTHFKIHWNNIRMFDNQWKQSDWWIGSISENRLFCKSWLKDWRFEWDVIWIIKWAKNIEAAEAIKWAEDAFNIEKVSMEPKSNKPSIWAKFNSLPELNEEQIEWLKGRWIEYNKHIKAVAKNNNWAISTAIKTEWWIIRWFQWRKIWANIDKKFRYQIEKWSEDWIFSYLPLLEKKVIFVVEGMTDFYTLVQFWINVIWIVSATAWIQYLKSFDKKYELIYIPDNDEAWIKSIETFERAKINYWKYILSNFNENIGDLNDLWNWFIKSWEDKKAFLSELYEESEKPLTNIELALKDAIKRRVNKWIMTWEPTFDWATGWINLWTTILINWPSSQGKTTWAMWILMKMLKQGKRVWFFSMETSTWKMLAQILGFHFWKNWKKEIIPNIEKYLSDYWKENLSNLYLYNDRKKLDLIKETIIEEKLEIVFIDYAQLVQWLEGKAMKEKMDYYAREIQQIAQDTYTATISLSQVSKSESLNTPVIFRTPKEAWALMEASDTFINVWTYQWKHKVAFLKCKEWDDDAWHTEHDTDWDKATWEIKIFNDKKLEDDWKM